VSALGTAGRIRRVDFPNALPFMVDGANVTCKIGVMRSDLLEDVPGYLIWRSRRAAKAFTIKTGFSNSKEKK
jgi:hypothetical protein